MPTANLTEQQLAITAAAQLHGKMLTDDAFMGYDGTIEQFEDLVQQCYYIAREEVSLEVEPVEQIVDAFYQFNYEIMAGERDVTYWM